MLDFQKRKKKYFDITLHDGTKLQIPTPTMGVYEALMDVSQNPETVDVNELKQVLAKVLALNKRNAAITDEQIEAFDLDDIYEFFLQYMEFIKETLSDPNSKSLIAR